MMRKIILAVSLAVSLAGCATVQRIENAVAVASGKIVTPQAVIIAANAFDAVKATATNYLRLPRCPKAQICRDPATSARVITLIRAGTADRNQLKAALRANPGANLSLVDIYDDLGNATSAIGALIGK